MAEQSAQHGQRLDDEMEHEVEALVRGAPVNARAREGLEHESTEQTTVPLGDPVEDEQHREIVDRSELARFLRPSALPADADVLIAVATEEHAPDEVLAELGALPRGVQFATVAEIWEALGHETEHRDSGPTGIADTAEPPPPAPGADVDDAPPATVLRPAPSSARPTATPTSVVPPVPEPVPSDPVRGAVVFGLELVRAGLGVVDRAIESVERALIR